ncbi:MAG: hypothetical protein AABO58_12020 [Acidobacteriota bacterium]
MSETEACTERRMEAAKTLLTFWHGHYWDSSRLLAQGWAFYLTIIAAIVGFVATRSLPKQTAVGLLWVAIIITAAHMLGAMLWNWGILKLVGTLEALNRELDSSLFDDLGLRKLFLRWRIVGAILVGFIVLIGITILTGLVLFCRTIGH